MTDINMIIVGNILTALEERGKEQKELAAGAGIPERTVRRMLNGGQQFGIGELKKIAGCLDVSLERLMMPTTNNTGADPIKHLMKRVKSKEAKETIRVADEVSDLIVFWELCKKVTLKPIRDSKTS